MGRPTRGQIWAREAISAKVKELGGEATEYGGFHFKNGQDAMAVMLFIEYTSVVNKVANEADASAKGKSRKQWEKALDLAIMHEQMGL